MSEDLNEIFELLRKEKFTIIKDIDDYFKCTICKDIVINAHEASCGCNYCQVCINNYKRNGSLNCPGNTIECKSANLSNISVNNRLNKQIPFLKVRCPYLMCLYECKLNEMENHMKFCTRRYVNCPFLNVGCGARETNYNKLNDHMLSEITDHNKILIDLIDNLRNEVYELKEKVERNRNEIEMIGSLRNQIDELKENVERNRNEIKMIGSLRNQIHELKENVERNQNQIEILKENDKEKTEIIQLLKDEIKQFNRNYIADQSEFNKHLLTEIDIIKIEIKDNAKSDDKVKRFDENVNYCKIIDPNKKINENEVSKNNFQNEIHQINKYLNMCDNGELLWSIGKISNLNEWTWSGYFYDRQNPYKMQLILFNKFEDFRIGLRIGSGNFDEDLKWPCQANMTIILGESGHYGKPFQKKLFIETIDSNPFGNDNYVTIKGAEFLNLLNVYKNYDLICKVKFI